MSMKKNLIDELEILLQFNLDTTQTGIKVHHDARQGLIEACERLYQKGLITQTDGGYLTELGHETAEHLQLAMRLLTPTSH